MRTNEFFEMMPNPDDSESQRTKLLEQVEDLLDQALKLQRELAVAISRGSKESSMEDANRLANQQEIIERYLKMDRKSSNNPELERMVEDLQRVVENLESHKRSYEK